MRNILPPLVIVAAFALWAGYVSVSQDASITRAHAVLTSRK